MTFLYLSMVEADEESKTPKKALAVVFGMALFVLMVAFGITSQYSILIESVLRSIDSEIIPE